MCSPKVGTIFRPPNNLTFSVNKDVEGDEGVDYVDDDSDRDQDYDDEAPEEDEENKADADDIDEASPSKRAKVRKTLHCKSYSLQVLHFFGEAKAVLCHIRKKDNFVL